MWILDTSYALPLDSDKDETINAIALKHGSGGRLGGGAGFGFRDADFEFSRKEDAEAAETEIQALDFDVETGIYEDNEDE